MGESKMEKNILLLPIKYNSKRLPYKNFLPINGKPLFFYSLEACHKAKVENKKIYISTEKSKMVEELIKTKLYINNVIVLDRPEYLTHDPYEISDVCIYEIENLAEKFDNLIMIQPSNPFIKPEDIENCYELFLKNNKKCVRSVTEIKKSVWVDIYNKPVCDIDKYKFISATNDERSYYIGNGSIVIIKIDDLLRFRSLISGLTVSYPMGGVDIDTKCDYLTSKVMIEGEK